MAISVTAGPRPTATPPACRRNGLPVTSTARKGPTGTAGEVRAPVVHGPKGRHICTAVGARGLIVPIDPAHGKRRVRAIRRDPVRRDGGAGQSTAALAGSGIGKRSDRRDVRGPESMPTCRRGGGLPGIQHEWALYAPW